MKKGFTLIELLAVIVILAIILAVAIPSVTGIVNNAKKSAFEDNTKMLLRAVSYKIAQNSSYDVTRVVKNGSTDTISSELGLDSSNYSAVAVSLQSGQPYVQITGTGKWDKLTAAGALSNVTVTDTPLDTTPPVITLTGSDPETMPRWSNPHDCYSYVLSEVSATDNVDGNLTSSIVMDNSLVCSVGGTYTIKYSVTDRSGNTATLQRTIIISVGGPMN